MLFFELGALVGFEGRHEFRLVENLGFSGLGRVNAPRFGNLGLLRIAHCTLFDTFVGVTLPEPFHRQLIRALGSFIRHTG